MTKDYDTIRSAAAVEKRLETMVAEGKPIGFDIESSYSSDSIIDKGATKQDLPSWFLVGVSFTNSKSWARYVPIAHAVGGNVDDVVRTARALWRMLQSGLGVAHNAAFELKGMSRWFRETLWDDPEVGAEVREKNGFFPIKSDTMVEAFLTQLYAPAEFGQGVGKYLKGLVNEIFGHKMTEFDDLFKDENGKKSKDPRFDRLDSSDPKVYNYACEDSLWCLEMHEYHYRMIKDSYIYKLEMKLLPVLIEMELEGLYLDWNTISAKAKEVDKFRVYMNEDIQAELSRRLNRTINMNLNSAPQMQKILFDPEPEGLGLPVKKRSKITGKPSSGDEALQVIAKADPIIRLILDYRQVVKLYGSYLHKYEVELNYKGNGRAYPSHNQLGAATGRMSVDGVSYQQWPKPYHYELENGMTFDFAFRDLLIAPEGYRIVGFDYSQVELRVLASLANETTLIEAFNSGQDVHKATAASMLGKPIEEVTKKDRAKGKTLNFAIVYGAGPDKIAESLSTPEEPVTKEDAIALLEQYFDNFSNLKNWMAARVVEGKEQGWVLTPFGRKFEVWEFRSKFWGVRNKGERMCVNAPVQGGAADYLKLAMVLAQKKIREAERDGLIPPGGIRMIMSVHDALEFYVHESVSTQTVIDLLGPEVTKEFGILPVKIKADWHEGYQWGGVAEVKLDENGKIIGYSMEYEKFWAKQTLEWEDENLLSVLDQYYSFLENEFGPETTKYYKSRRPEFKPVVVPGEVSEQDPTEAWRHEVEDDVPIWAHTPEVWERLKNEEPEDFHVVVTVTEMPDESQWSKFQAYLDERPGKNVVRFSTPEGQIEFDKTFNISKADQPYLSLILGGASVALADAGVNEEELLEGVSL